MNMFRIFHDDPVPFEQPASLIPWIPSATQLMVAGIQFRMKTRAKSFLDITFQNGKLEIPQLVVDDQTNVLFKNLIAFEQCSQEAGTQITAYASLMDCIINTAADVELLQKDQIIINASGGNTEAYEPAIVSLGPFHHHKSDLKAMDHLKWHYLNKFLGRNPKKPLDDYLKLIKENERQARMAYSEEVEMNRIWSLPPVVAHGSESSTSRCHNFSCMQNMFAVSSWPSSWINKSDSSRGDQDATNTSLIWIPSATQLKEAGVHIRKKKKKKAKSFMDITFRDGKMEIPQLLVDDQTNTLLRNLIAFEQCCNEASRHVTSYVGLIDCIVDTTADVALLQQSKIIINGMGNGEEVATLFNRLGKES
ncbi:UPF0481 protein [Musa troglodytarum]|uniref:UPF0481 protein n=1 Tax=Musa troglodytarum TaxID=320322 RepID=A0A9E7FLB7_9LILI|nr:UPF0481 protein [Musa troglodytarum]